MAACGALVLVGLLAAVVWGGRDVRPAPNDDGDASAPQILRRYLRGVVLAVASGAGAGLLVAGAGGRLAMRLLAATAGPSAQGRLTEAEEIVGRITTDGTFGFIVFTGLFFGLPSGALYMLLRRWLPRGRLAGPAFGLLLLVVAAPYLDPLRPENPDFDIVGPGWLAVVVFSAMALLHGMVVAALAARYSERLPLIELKVRTLIRYLPLLVLLPAFPVLLPVALGAVVAMAVGGLGVWTSSRIDAVGRAVLLAAGLVALPWFIGAVIDIAGRGP